MCAITIQFNPASTVPVYKQIAEAIQQEILSGRLPAGHRLPTVRDLALQLEVARGTAKHAYDLLERMALIEKTQGRGTFVCPPTSGTASLASKKEQALDAIDQLFNQLEDLGFPLRDIRIYLELKLRQREEAFPHVRVGAVDCSVEALSSTLEQLAGIDNLDMYEFLLDNVLDSPTPFDPGMDLLFTTHTHYSALKDKLPSNQQLLQISMSVSPLTVLNLARIPAGSTVGIITASQRFSSIIHHACEEYCLPGLHFATALLDNPAAMDYVLENCTQLILPPHYHRFCTPAQRDKLHQHEGKCPHILYQYQIERGSLLYLEQEIQRIAAQKNAGI